MLWNAISIQNVPIAMLRQSTAAAACSFGIINILSICFKFVFTPLWTYTVKKDGWPVSTSIQYIKVKSEHDLDLSLRCSDREDPLYSIINYLK